MTALYVAFGAAFGFALSRSGAADYGLVQGMFLFEQFQLYGIMATAVLLTAPGLWWIRRHGRTALGDPLQVELKPMTRGTVVGGLLFGVGWSMTGMCPGPILVNIGEGKIYGAGRRTGRRRAVRVALRTPAGHLPPSACHGRARIAVIIFSRPDWFCWMRRRSP